MKISERATKISFKDQATHVIQFDPSAELEEREGQNGAYFVVPVLENGSPALLSVSSNRLTKKLQQYNKPCTLKITREGTGFETDFKVEQILEQAPLTKKNA